MARNVVELALAALALGSPVWLFAGNTDALARAADAVVVGHFLPGQQPTASSFRISVVRSIKGDLPPGTTVSVLARVSGEISPSGPFGEAYGVWFLRKSGGQWTFVPPNHLGLAVLGTEWFPLPKTASPASVHIPSKPATVGDQIALEIAAALLADPSRYVFGLSRHLLGVQDSPVLRDLWHMLRADPNPELRFLGLTGLLRGPERTGALAEIADNIHLIRGLHSDVVSAIRGFRGSDPAAIRSLAKIASSPDMNLQRSAADALQAIHTPETLPLLAVFLDSTDAEVRRYALWGFGKFVMNEPIEDHTNLPGKLSGPPGPKPYRTADTVRHDIRSRPRGSTDDAEYVQFWKSWWGNMKDRFAAKAP